MNIKEAKEFIKNTVKVYLAKDEYGDYKIPVGRQRPIFLLGAPGIGKTAIMEQVAEEMGIALVSYSMTHHTRQSALGLPFISTKEYGGEKYSVSEYTMSEIIASVYETMEKSGEKEGILFLDEINCVSETLYPSMLQFLQFKVFGNHSVPEGWVVVTAGNPPEYNRSVRSFDVVTLDRLKVMEIEPDYPAWKSYAVSNNVHPAIIAFLDNNKSYFYMMENTVSGMSYVTARGWEDLSTVISLYEASAMTVTEELVAQYIRNEKVTREFTVYYELYNKYKKIYRINEVLHGEISDEVVKGAQGASQDERLALTAILTNTVKNELKTSLDRFEDLKDIQPVLRSVLSDNDIPAGLRKQIEAREVLAQKRKAAGTLSYEVKQKNNRIKALYGELLSGIEDGQLSEAYNRLIDDVKADVEQKKKILRYYFDFISRAFGEESNEMLLGVTELTLSKSASKFLNAFGSEEYGKYSKLLMLDDRTDKLKEEVSNFFDLQGIG